MCGGLADMAEARDYSPPDKPAPSEEQKAVAPQPDIKITGRFDQHRSSYWSGWLAIAGGRYATRPFLRHHWDAPNGSHFNRHKYAAGAGVLMNSVAAYYAKHTWDDMHSIFCQPLAWEFNKDPKDVNLKDFLNSKNTIVHQTIENYKKYNTRRFTVNSAFFLPLLVPVLNLFLKKPVFKNIHPETGVDLGMAANAGYLFSDVLSRKATPFETMQYIIDSKINHTEHSGDQITAGDLLDIYERHAAKGGICSFKGQRGTPEWDRSTELFERMANLLNQTHNNIVATEKADFGLSKFIFLVGHGMIDPENIERSQANVEIANFHGVEAMKALAAGGKEMSLEQVVAAYPVPRLQGQVGVENTEEAVVPEFAARPGNSRSQGLTGEAPALSIAHREEQRRATTQECVPLR